MFEAFETNIAVSPWYFERHVGTVSRLPWEDDGLEVLLLIWKESTPHVKEPLLSKGTHPQHNGYSVRSLL